MRRASAIAVLGGILIACSAHGQPPPAGAAAFHAKVAALYSFEPHTLTQQQIDAKSNALDQFWTEVKADPKRYRPLLRRELRDGSNPAYFSYDGAKLLLAISQDPKDRALALQSIPRVDLRGIQPTDYLRTVHSFAINGFDTTKAALRILDYPDFKAFIPQHALTLGQDYSLIYMLFPMPETKFVPALIERLGTETNVVSQKSILLALWYAVTPEAKAAAARFMSDASKPREARDYARELAEKKVHAQGAPAAATAEKLKEERRKALSRISDEALLEFDSLTVMLLTRQ